MEDILQQYENAVEQVTKFFCKKYFKDDYVYDRKHWIGEEIGGQIWINDYWFNFGHIVDYIKYDYTEDEMFEHYDYDLGERTAGRIPINIRNYKKLQ